MQPVRVGVGRIIMAIKRSSQCAFTRGAAIGLAIVLVAASCSDSSDSSTGDATGTTTASQSAATSAPATTVADSTFASGQSASNEDESAGRLADTAAAEIDDGGGAGLGGLDTLTPADIGRDIVFSAEVALLVEDVTLSSQAVLDAVAPLGGLLFGQRTTTEPIPRTVLNIKVLPEDFQEALRRLSGIGELRSQTVTAEDVTDRIVDLESRITTAETSVDRLRVLLEGAIGLDEVSALERELLAREQSLELLRGQLRTIRDAVGLASITVIIDEKVDPIPRPLIELEVDFYVGDDAGIGCPAIQPVAIDESDLVTVCYQVTNSGDTLLSEVVVSDRALDIAAADVVRLSTPASETLAPGDTWLYYAVFEATSTSLSTSRVTATPVETIDRVTAAIGGESVSNAVNLTVGVRADDSLPGFSDAFGRAVDVLKVIIAIIIIVVAFAIPFLWIFPLVFVIVLGARRRKERIQHKASEKLAAARRPEPSAPADDQ